MRKIILAGGSGFLGNVLAKHFHQQLYDIVILSRSPQLYSPFARFTGWNGKTSGTWEEEFENADAVINLTGRSVNCRYNEKNKKEILESRVNSTHIVGEAIRQCKNPPRLWINAGSATIYRHSMIDDRAEDSVEIGDDFSMSVCKAWEHSFWEMDTPGTRKMVMRTSLVLGNYKNSVLPVLKRLTRFGLGGRMGSGEQFFSWIHEDDYVRATEFLLHRADLSGTFNFTAPVPLHNKDFMKLLRKEMKMPAGMGAAKWMLKLGAMVIGTEPELILKSRKVVPKRLLEEGFVFQFPEAGSALHDLIQRNSNH